MSNLLQTLCSFLNTLFILFCLLHKTEEIKGLYLFKNLFQLYCYMFKDLCHKSVEV